MRTPSFQDNPALKTTLFNAAVGHRRAVTLGQGVYADRGLVCHLGCCVTAVPGWDQAAVSHAGGWHHAYGMIVGCNPRMAYLQEWLFEALPLGKARLWSETVIEATPVGVDLDAAYWSFMSAVVADREHGVLTRCGGDTRCANAVANVARECRLSYQSDRPRGDRLWLLAGLSAGVTAKRVEDESACWAAIAATQVARSNQNPASAADAMEAAQAAVEDEDWTGAEPWADIMARRLIVELANAPALPRQAVTGGVLNTAVSRREANTTYCPVV